MLEFSVADDPERDRLLRPQLPRPLLRRPLPRRRGDGPLRRGVPLQPGRARRRVRLPDGLAAVALLLAQHRPPPADGGAGRAGSSSRSASSSCSSRSGSSGLPPAHARALLGGDAGGRAARPRGDGTGAYTVSAVGLNVTKRMRLLLPCSAAAALLAIGLYFLLIPPFGFVGAAWATAGGLWSRWRSSSASSPSGSTRCPGSGEPRPRGRAHARALLASLAVDAWVPFDASLAVRVVITLAYPPVLLALGGFLPRAPTSRPCASAPALPAPRRRSS